MGEARASKNASVELRTLGKGVILREYACNGNRRKPAIAAINGELTDIHRQPLNPGLNVNFHDSVLAMRQPSLPQCESAQALMTTFCADNGSECNDAPPELIALTNAGAIGGVPGSPTPVGGAEDGTIWTSTFGI